MAKKKIADSVSFEAADKNWTLRLTPRAWIELEDEGLGDVKTLGGNLEKNPSFKTFAIVFACALRGGEKDYDITSETALDLADELGSAVVLDLVGQVVQASFPDAKGDAGNVKAKSAQAKK